MRALSSSWAYFNNISIEEVVQAAVWPNQTTFARFYLREMQKQQENLQLLGSVVAAQKVVGVRWSGLMEMLNLTEFLSYATSEDPGIETEEI